MIELYHGDCRAFLSHYNGLAFDAVITNERDALGLNRKNSVSMRVSGIRSLIFLPSAA